MQLPQWLNLKFKDILILLAIFGLFIRGEFRKPSQPIVTTQTEIKYIHHRDTVELQPIVYQTVHKDTVIQKYIPSKNPDTLRTQYTELLTDYKTNNIYKDTIKIDSIGYVEATNLVGYNKLLSSKYKWDIKEKIITNTITIREPYKPKNQFYYGGGVGTSFQGVINQVNLGIGLKNKKDQILLVQGGWNFPQSTTQLQLSYFKKLGK